MNLKIIKSNVSNVDIEYLHSYKFYNGVGFPKSYQDFAIKYGYGLSCRNFIIYLPLKEDNCDSFTTRTLELKQIFDETIKNNWYLTLEPSGDINLFRSCVPFGISENGYFLFWDIQEQEEFDIYMTDFRGYGVRKVGNTLNEFLEVITSPQDYKKILISDDEPLEAVFESF